jgi:hypothetical protein
MPDYAIEFEAHIVESKRPENFPRSVFIREQYQNVESDQQLKEIYNARVKTIVTNPGIVVFPDNEIIDGTALNFDQRIYIPWHMVSYFQGNVKLITPAPVAKTPLDNLVPADPTPEKEKTLIQ